MDVYTSPPPSRFDCRHLRNELCRSFTAKSDNGNVLKSRRGAMLLSAKKKRVRGILLVHTERESILRKGKV